MIKQLIDLLKKKAPKYAIELNFDADYGVTEAVAWSQYSAYMLGAFIEKHHAIRVIYDLHARVAGGMPQNIREWAEAEKWAKDTSGWSGWALWPSPMSKAVRVAVLTAEAAREQELLRVRVGSQYWTEYWAELVAKGRECEWLEGDRLAELAIRRAVKAGSSWDREARNMIEALRNAR